jgi:drug/metabolite transporter (DMT)-like permease
LVLFALLLALEQLLQQQLDSNVNRNFICPIWVWIFLNEIPPLSVLIGGIAIIISAIIIKKL